MKTFELDEPLITDNEYPVKRGRERRGEKGCTLKCNRGGGGGEREKRERIF